MTVLFFLVGILSYMGDTQRVTQKGNHGVLLILTVRPLVPNKISPCVCPCDDNAERAFSAKYACVRAWVCAQWQVKPSKGLTAAANSPPSPLPSLTCLVFTHSSRRTIQRHNTKKQTNKPASEQPNRQTKKNSVYDLYRTNNTKPFGTATKTTPDSYTT